MHKFSKVANLPVRDMHTARVVGAVDDILFCKTDRLLTALHVVEKNRETHLIDSQDIFMFGKCCILVDFSQHKLRQKGDFGAHIIRYVRDAHKKPVISPNGVNIGFVHDIAIEVFSGGSVVSHLELTDGIVQDLINGRKEVLVNDSLQFFDDAVSIANNNFQFVKSGTKGIKNIFRRNAK